MTLNLRKKLTGFTFIVASIIFSIFLLLSIMFFKTTLKDINSKIIIKETNRAAKEISKKLSANIATTLNDANFTDVNTTDFESHKTYLSNIKPFGVSEAYLLSEKGIIISASDDHKPGKLFTTSNPKQKKEGQSIVNIFKQSDQYFLELDIDKEKTIISYAPVIVGNNKPWYLVVKTPKSALLKEADGMATTILIIGFLGIIFVSVTVYLFTGKIANSIAQSAHITSDISSGNLTKTIEYKKEKDEIDMLNNSLITMRNKLTDVIKLIHQNSQNIQSASDKLDNNSSTLSEAAAAMASSSEELSASIEEMTANIAQNTDNARKTSEISHITLESVKDSNLLTQRMREAVGSVAERISIIQDIAAQTNILSLNAAVEAARAGDSGKGFSVVATEVKNLAERSQTAAKDIEKLSRRALIISERTGNNMENLVPEIEKNSLLIDEISSANIEQNMSIQQISSALQELNNGTQQNASLADTLAQSADELNNFASELQEHVSYFKLGSNK